MLTPGERDALFVQYVNHAPQARLIADKADVAWGGNPAFRRRSRCWTSAARARNRVATIGPLSADQHAQLSARFPKIANLNRAYIRLRQVKSAEELDWLRIGAHFSDLGMAALRDGMKIGHERARIGRPGRARLRFAGRDQRHPLHRHHVDERARSGRAAAVSDHAARAGGRRGGGRDQRGVLGASGPGAAQLRARRAEQALSRSACGGRCRLRCHRRGAQGRRHAGAGDRSLQA